MDWLEDFEKRFNYKELQTIKQDKKHGFVQINFCDGVVMNCNFNLHLKAVNIDNNSNSTLKQGG